MDNTVVTSIVSMAGLGFLFASVLAFVSRKLKVEEDPRVERINEALPGLNCGACGFTNCREYAAALARGEIGPDKCKVGGEKVAESLCEILGVSVQKRTKETAVLHCGADASRRKKKANYTGIMTCLAAHNTFGGEALCAYGCLGYGDCRLACPFGAIAIINGLPRIDKDKCTACGVCVSSCPRRLISVEKIPTDNFLYVACNNSDKGPETRRACPVGCIACGICEKQTGGIFCVKNNLARVRCDRIKDIGNTEEVIKKCPTKCIVRI